MPDYRTPGVYIEELPATGPIAGVGTSTAAFIGPAVRGPLTVPTKVTNWTQFKDVFGEYLIAPRFFLAYAMRSFFENGGTVAYVVRVGTAVRAYKDLPDQVGAGKFALHVEAQQEGPAGNQIQLDVTTTNPIVAGAKVRRERAKLKSNTPKDVITLEQIADASKFAVGDWVTIEASNPAERAQIARIFNDQLILASALVGTYTATDWVRIANLINQKSFRVESAAGLEAGSAIHIADQENPVNEEDAVVASVTGDRVTLDKPLTKTYSLLGTASQPEVHSWEFDLKVTNPGFAPERFDKLAMDPRHSRYWSRALTSAFVTVTQPPPATATTATPPANRPAPASTTLNGGTADTLPPPLTKYDEALDALERVDDVSILCVPDRTDPSAQGKVVAHCEKMGDRFAVLDSSINESPFDPPPKPSVAQHRASLSSARGYAALYYPWLLINDPASPTGEDTLLIPPSGAIAGIYARSDAQFGVFKAPANEEIRNAIGLETVLTDVEQGELNVEGVNVVRLFPGIGRPVVWGARTIAPKDVTAWRYVNIRRLFLYIEESLQEGLRPWVFDPNDLGLWKRLARTTSEFLTRVWRSGALFGATAADAFYVKVDEENNPESVRALGEVVVEIGIAPVRPAEFVVVRIGFWAGRSNVSEQ